MRLREQIRILVVDDMSTSRGLIIQSLEAMGIRHITSCVDGTSALAELEKSPVHLVISDFNMPSMDGLQLLQQLRSREKTKAVGFILITGRADQNIVGAGKKFGMNNLIKKPFTPEELRSCIEAVVGRL